MTRTALVTGATGFIGARLCRALKKGGWNIRALALPGENCNAIADFEPEIIRGDITRAQTELGWKTRISYVEAMERIREWVQTGF